MRWIGRGTSGEACGPPGDGVAGLLRASLKPKGQPIAQAEEEPLECVVMLVTHARVEVVRAAPKQPFTGLRFDVWTTLANAVPLARDEGGSQMELSVLIPHLNGKEWAVPSCQSHCFVKGSSCPSACYLS